MSPIRLHSSISPDLDSTFDLANSGLPSNELLDYYRRKVASLTAESDAFQSRLDRLAKITHRQNNLHEQLQESDVTTHRLRDQLSEVQILVHKERDHVLRLYAEIDRLKLRELDDRRRIQYLLRLSGLASAEAAYFLPDCAHLGEQFNASKAVVSCNRRCMASSCPFRGSSTKGGRGRKPCSQHNSRVSAHADNTIANIDYQSVVWDLKCSETALYALKKQLEEQSKAAQDRIESLLVDRRELIKARQAQTHMLKARIVELQDQVKSCQTLLLESANENLRQRRQYCFAKGTWMGEKTSLLAQQGVSESHPSKSNGTTEWKLHNQLTSQGKTSRTKSVVALTPAGPQFVEPVDVSKMDGIQRREYEHRKTTDEVQCGLEQQQQQQLATTHREQVSPLCVLMRLTCWWSDR
uniref:DUF4201 domain-containing protein n=1 Tax=Mesocestoides corti TaxID=53468 RepID=A0A5K3ERY2_MESCO